MLLILATESGCQVEILPARNADDGFARLTNEERQMIRPVGSKEQAELALEMEPAVFTEWHAFDAINEVGRHAYTWLVIGAGWCPHSQQVLRTLSSFDSLLAKLNVQPIVLYRTYDVRYLMRKSIEYRIRFPVGFIANSVYGDSEEEKQYRFLEELTGVPASGCVPFNLLLDRSGHVLARQCGPISDVREFLRMALQEE